MILSSIPLPGCQDPIEGTSSPSMRCGRPAHVVLVSRVDPTVTMTRCRRHASAFEVHSTRWVKAEPAQVYRVQTQILTLTTLAAHLRKLQLRRGEGVTLDQWGQLAALDEPVVLDVLERLCTEWERPVSLDDLNED